MRRRRRGAHPHLADGAAGRVDDLDGRAARRREALARRRHTAGELHAENRYGRPALALPQVEVDVPAELADGEVAADERGAVRLDLDRVQRRLVLAEDLADQLFHEIL